MESSHITDGTSEIGSLTAHSNDESQFVGSSSGVYFINTVRQAFSKNLDRLSGSPAGQEFPQPEDTLLGSDASLRDKCSAASSIRASSPATDALSHWEYDPAIAAVLGSAPPLDLARQLMMVYFKVWHPLFPFLHGPSFLQAMESLYSDRGQNAHTHAPSPSSSPHHRNACWTTIFQCVFNLASHLRPDLQFPPESRIRSSTSMYSLLGTLTSRNDLPSLQALLASQLFLVSKMSLRTASTVGGCMLRSMLHAGLHRCPFRYRELSSHDRQLRKRIFWSAYAIDRYLSQALGLPLGIQDSDIDVCGPTAQEIHFPGCYKAQIPSMGWSSSLARQSPTDSPIPSHEDPTHTPPRPIPQPQSNPHPQQPPPNKREIVFASYVESGTLTGRALELFHKSILVRSVRRSSVLFLVTDVHKWWNGLSIDLQSTSPSTTTTTSTTTKEPSNPPFNFTPFFTVLYQHLILLLNRPSLSLGPTTPEFCSALQTCIGAAREILAALKAQVDAGQALFWPGFVSAAWMAGLVLAFACQLGQYVVGKGAREISKCLDFLHLMSGHWETARNCHRALSILSQNIHSSVASTSTTSASMSTTQPARQLPRTPGGNGPSGGQSPREDNDGDVSDRKRRRVDSRAGDDGVVFQGGVSTPVSGFLSQGVHYPLEPSSIPAGGEGGEDRLFFPDGTTTMMDFDLNMADLLQGGNFDNLLDMFGQQYPSF